MSLPPATVFGLAERCAPAVSAQTLSAVALAESGLNPLAIHVNRGRPSTTPTSRAEGIAAAKSLMASGADFDVGLLQINVANLRQLGLSLEDAFDPCRNIAAGADLLRANYSAARVRIPAPQAALHAALSRYNTGDERRGLRNGYVARVIKAVAQLEQSTAPGPTPRPVPPARPWDAFGDLGRADFVLALTPPSEGSLP